MKKILMSVTALVVLFTVFVACSDDDNNNVITDNEQNKMTYNNVDYELSTGLLLDLSSTKVESNAFLMIFHTKGIDIPVTNDGYAIIHGANGIGSFLGFTIHSSNSEYLEERIYTYDPEETGAVGTFNEGEIILNQNIAQEMLTDKADYIDISSGTLKVKKITGGYEFELNCVCEEGNTISLKYIGVVNTYKILLNYFMYDGEIYMLDKAIMVAVKNGSTGNYIHSLGLFSSEIALIEKPEDADLEGTGDFIYFAICSANPDRLDDGDYEYVLYSDEVILELGQYYDVEFGHSYKFEPGVEVNANTILSGTLNIDKHEDDDEYDFVFSGVDADGKKIIGIYIGIPEYYDYTHIEY